MYIVQPNTLLNQMKQKVVSAYDINKTVFIKFLHNNHKGKITVYMQGSDG